MRTALRYTISLTVGLVVTVLAAEFATSDYLIMVSLLPLYGAVTSMLLAHKQQWLALSRGESTRSTRKRGAIIGGLGAFTGCLLLQASIPAGLAGYGLMLLGMAGAIGDMAES
ncbi:hypothetical protein [Haloarcula sebkhae]|uniref:DUF8153 domain-containing protein n=2 Tax=Haloarcula sebkhae TaxID=932660 RepID=A0A830EQQ3_9EURY|nr:hypothetical protein [Haloarcula sebkhae]GGK84830.1 hypothetical protein GCM10009067_41200 [Haloarcula sebkhae]